MALATIALYGSRRLWTLVDKHSQKLDLGGTESPLWADNRGRRLRAGEGFLGRELQTPHQLGGLGNAVSFPRRVHPGQAQAANRFFGTKIPWNTTENQLP